MRKKLLGRAAVILGQVILISFFLSSSEAQAHEGPQNLKKKDLRISPF